jgi:hypothetical protein
MENHENLVVHLVTLIFPNFSEDRVCADSVGKLIPLLVIYLPLVAFLCEDHFPTVGCSVDYCVGGICNWSRNNGVLRVTTTKSVLGVAAVGLYNNRENCKLVTWSHNMKSALGVATVGLCLELQQQKVHLELQQRGIATTVRSCNYCITHV